MSVDIQNVPNVYQMKCPRGVYSVIVRVYTSLNTPSIYPNYVPSISGLIASQVTPEQRIVNSNKLQVSFQQLFTKKVKNKTLPDIFKGITNFNAFFLPSKSIVDVAFPNPFACYLTVFPSTNNVIKVMGLLQNNIGYQNSDGIRFVSFMASNMSTTATDNSISFNELSLQPSTVYPGYYVYTVYVAYSEHDALGFGYNPTIDNFIGWGSSNINPILLYRIVQTNTTGNNPSTSGVFSLDNTQNVDANTVQSVMGVYYPVATCY